MLRRGCVHDRSRDSAADGDRGIILDGTTQPRYGTAPDNVCADSNTPSYMRLLVTSTAEYMIEILDPAEATLIRGFAFTGNTSNEAIRIHTLEMTRVQCNHFGLNGEGTIGADLGRGSASPVTTRGERDHRDRW